jgi:hypothetical protein
MANRSESTGRIGATRLGLLDVLTILIILTILLYAAWKQFPAFNDRVIAPVQQPTAAPTSR